MIYLYSVGVKILIFFLLFFTQGTDSKLGVGFRLGPNADIQFQLELGPQINTSPIGNAANSAGAAAKKRHAMDSGNVPKDWLNKWRFQMSPGYVPKDFEQTPDREQNAVPGNAGISDAVAHLRQLYKPQPTVMET